jgi:hypothetical protein
MGEGVEGEPAAAGGCGVSLLEGSRRMGKLVNAQRHYQRHDASNKERWIVKDPKHRHSWFPNFRVNYTTFRGRPTRRPCAARPSFAIAFFSCYNFSIAWGYDKYGPR